MSDRFDMRSQKIILEYSGVLRSTPVLYDELYCTENMVRAASVILL
jgi:hypothetical protein